MDTPTNLRVLTRDEAADMLGISRLGLDRLHMEGAGPARLRLSARRVGYRLSDLRAWLDSRIEQRAPSMDVAPTSPAAPSPSVPI